MPSDERIRYVVYALEQGWSVEEVSQLTSIDPWFLDQFQQFAELQGSIRATTLETIDAELLRKAKRDGFSDRRISFLLGTTAEKATGQAHQPWHQAGLQDGRYLRS